MITSTIKKLCSSFIAVFVVANSAIGQDKIDSDFYSDTVLDEMLTMSEPLGDEFYTGIEEYISWRNQNFNTPYQEYVSWVSGGSYDKYVLDISLISAGVAHVLTKGNMTPAERHELDILLTRHTSPDVTKWFSNPNGWYEANTKAKDKISGLLKNSSR